MDPVITPTPVPEIEVEVEPEVEPEPRRPVVQPTPEPEPEPDPTPKPLIEVDVDEPPEEPEPDPDPDPEVDPGSQPPVVLIPPVTTVDEDGNMITECPEGYKEVQTPEGVMCEKITTTTRTTGRKTYGVGRTATTGLAGNIGRQVPRSRTRTTTSTSRSRVRPTTRRA